MKKQLIIFGIAVLLICVVFSGCNENGDENLQEENTTTLSDGTIVTGDIGQIEITEHSADKKRIMRWDLEQSVWEETEEGDIEYKYPGMGYYGWEEVPWDLDITNISNNLTKRKEIYLNYIRNGESEWSLEGLNLPPFTEYVVDGGLHYGRRQYVTNKVINLRLEDDALWYITGTAKNIGDNFLNFPSITVNFYDANGVWLAKQTDSSSNIASGYTWGFAIEYNKDYGKYSNDIDHISFEVDANPYDW